MGIKRYTLDDLIEVEGRLEFWERVLGERRWSKVLEAENIVVNGWYNDLFAVLGGGSVVLAIGGLALGYGSNATNRGDTGLALEWTTARGFATTQASGLSTVTIQAPGLPHALVSGNTFTLNGVTYTVGAAGAAAGATSIPITTTTGAGITAGMPVVLTSTDPTTPQRMGVTLTTPVTSDPPQDTFSFYLPAAGNTVALTFTEAGLLYKNPSLTPGVAASFMSHVGFAYIKGVNTDLRIDYALARSLT